MRRLFSFWSSVEQDTDWALLSSRCVKHFSRITLLPSNSIVINVISLTTTLHCDDNSYSWIINYAGYILEGKNMVYCQYSLYLCAPQPLVSIHCRRWQCFIARFISLCISKMPIVLLRSDWRLSFLQFWNCNMFHTVVFAHSHSHW